MASSTQASTMDGDVEKGNPLNHTVTIGADLYEKLYLSPKNEVAGDLRRRFANPTPLGLFGIFITIGSFSVISMGWNGATTLNGVAGTFFFTGPVLLILATIFEWVLGNFFAFMVMGVFAVFWASFGTLLLPSWGIAASYSATGNAAEGALSVGYNTALGFYLIFWGFGLFVLLICSIRTNIAFVTVFVVLVTGVFTLAGAYFKVASGNLVEAARLQKAGAAFCFVVAVGVYYLLVVTMLGEMRIDLHLPVGDLSGFWEKRDARKERQE